MHVRPLPSQERSASARRRLVFDGHLPRRIILLAAIVAVHLLIIAWLLTQPPAERAREARGETVIAISLSTGDHASASPQSSPELSRAAVRAPVPLPLLLMPSLLTETTEADRASGVTGGGSACQLAADAAVAIQQDSVAMAELAALPPGVRSEADAVMLWNGVWFDQAPPANSTSPVVPTGGLHLAIERIVAAAPAQCRDEAMLGPLFVPIPVGDRTTMLAIGSGAWRWSDLLSKPSALPGDGSMPTSGGGLD